MLAEIERGSAITSRDSVYRSVTIVWRRVRKSPGQSTWHDRLWFSKANAGPSVVVWATRSVVYKATKRYATLNNFLRCASHARKKTTNVREDEYRGKYQLRLGDDSYLNSRVADSSGVLDIALGDLQPHSHSQPQGWPSQPELAASPIAEPPMCLVKAAALGNHPMSVVQSRHVERATCMARGKG